MRRNFRKWICVLCCLVACVEFLGCHEKKPETAEIRNVEVEKKEEAVKIDQKLFLSVPLNSMEPNPCSPTKPGPNWRGIIIQAPKQVLFNRERRIGKYRAFAAIPICGYFLLDVPAAPTRESMRLFALDRRTGDIYSGDIVDRDESPIKPPPKRKPVDPELLKGLASGGYFNPNLADFVHLPEQPATYDVHVEFRGFRSNVVTIELVEERE